MVERSSDQIIKPINLDALTTWVGTYPEVSNPVQFGTLWYPDLGGRGRDGRNRANAGQAGLRSGCQSAKLWST